MATTANQFKKSYQEILDFICAGVPVFGDDDPVKKQKRIARARVDKIYFAKEYFPHYCENEPADIHKDMFHIADTTGIGVLLYGFRGSAKSTIISLIDVVHKIVFKQRKFIGFISSSQEAAEEYGIAVKAELEVNQRIINDFGDLRGSNKWENGNFITKTGIRVISLGWKMSPKGKKNMQYRFDHIIIEDIESRTTPNSPKVIKKIINFLLKDAYKATVPVKFSFIFIGNYFSRKSVLHKLMEHNDCSKWVKKAYPALVEDTHGNMHSTWEERFPTDKLMEALYDMPETERVEMMQKPEGDEGEFDREWFKIIDYSEVPTGIKVATYVDPAVGKTSLTTETSKKCFQAIVVIGVDEIMEAGKRKDFILYVLDSSIRKESTMDMVTRHYDLSIKYKSQLDGVESFGYQQVLINDYEREEVKRGKRLNIHTDRNPSSKDARITSLQSPIKRGKIIFVRHQGLNLLIDQFMDFPDGFIDGPDAVACLEALISRKILKIKKQVKSMVLGG